MRTVNKFRLLTVGTIAALGLTLVAPGAASADAISAAPEIILTAQQQTDIAAVEASSAAGVFDPGAALAAGASEEAVAGATAVYAAADWTIVGNAVEPNSDFNDLAAAALACTGASGYNGWFFPWGSQFGVNSCLADQLIAALALGAAGAGAVAAVLTAIGATAVAGGVATIVAALLGVGAAAIAACKSFGSNGGIWLNLGGTPMASCWGQ